MKLVLSGYYGFDNVGDEAILYAILSALREANPDVEPIVLSNQPEKTARTYRVEAVNRWKLKDVARAIRQSDGVISGGGSLLQDVTGMRSVVYYSAIMWLAKLFRKPLFIYAQGIGPLQKKTSEHIVRLTLARSDYVSVRDEESKKLLLRLGLRRPIDVVPDPVLGIDVTEAAQQPRLIDEPFVSVSVRDWPTDQNYKRKLAACLDEIVRHGYGVVFVPMQGKEDEAASADTVAYMKEKATIAPFDGSIMQKIAWIAQSELLVGMRLHALIFAAVSETPFIALSYDPKIDAFANMCKQPLFAHVNDDWNENVLAERMKERLSKREEAIASMRTYTEQAKKEARRTARVIVNKV